MASIVNTSQECMVFHKQWLEVIWTLLSITGYGLMNKGARKQEQPKIF
mgnify:CR=1 FL=1